MTRGRWQLGWLVLMAVGVPMLLAWMTGSLAIPHNDTWAYSRIAQVFAETGHIQLLEWNRASLIGQVVVLGPLGRAIWTQQFAVGLLAAGSLVVTYRLLLPLTTHRRALFGTAIIAAFPGFGLLATSFMGDIPAYFAALLCLLLGQRAITRKSVPFLALVLLVGLWGYAIRQQVIAAPVAVLAVCAVSWRARRLRAWLIVLGLIFIGLLAGYERWRSGLPGADPPSYPLTLVPGIKSALKAYFTLALLVAPASFLTARPSSWSRPTRLLGVTVGLVGAVTATFVGSLLFLGNYLSRGGSYSGVSLGTREVFPRGLWVALLVIACVSGALLPGILMSHWRRMGRLLGVFTLLTAAGSVFQGFVGQGLSDRYLLTLMPGVLVACLAGPARRVYVSVPVLAGYAALSLSLTANALAFDAASWHLARELELAGNHASSIDAGLAWVGYHSPGRAVSASNPNAWPNSAGWWQPLFKDSSPCIVVTASPLPGYVTAAVRSYRTYAVVGESTLWVQTLPSCGVASVGLS